MRYRIICADKADRDALVCILARNGYAVRVVRMKEKNAYRYFIEYWEEL